MFTVNCPPHLIWNPWPNTQILSPPSPIKKFFQIIHFYIGLSDLPNICWHTKYLKNINPKKYFLSSYLISFVWHSRLALTQLSQSFRVTLYLYHHTTCTQLIWYDMPTILHVDTQFLEEHDKSLVISELFTWYLAHNKCSTNFF